MQELLTAGVEVGAQRVEVRLDGRRLREAVDGMDNARRTDASLVEQGGEAAGERGGIAWWHQRAEGPTLQDLARAARGVGADDPAAAGHRLDQRAGETFVDGRQREDRRA